jgi:hypothetical protein
MAFWQTANITLLPANPKMSKRKKTKKQTFNMYRCTQKLRSSVEKYKPNQTEESFQLSNYGAESELQR